YDYDYDYDEEYDYYDSEPEYAAEPIKQRQVLELRRKADDKVEVTTAQTYTISSDELQSQLSFFGGLFSPQFLASGAWMSELLLLSMFVNEIELEEGLLIQLWDGSRL